MSELEERTIALIPARAGSKRVPRKNLAEIGGKSLLLRAVECAHATGSFSEIYVSTDDPEAAEAAQSAGADVIHRPTALCQDNVVLDDVVVHALEHLGAKDLRRGAVCLMNPTAPLRTVADVRGAVNALWSHRAEFVCTATSYDHHPYYALEEAEGRLRPHFQEDVFAYDRADLPTLYRPIAVARVGRWDAVLRHRTTFGPSMLLYEVDAVSAVDIDTPLDLAFARYLATHRPSRSREGDQ